MANVPYQDAPPAPVGIPETRVPDDYQRIQSSPAAFGGLIAQGADRLGQGATTASKFFGAVQTDDLINQTHKQINGLAYGQAGANQLDANGNQVLDSDGKPIPDAGALGLKGEAALRRVAQVQGQFDQIVASNRDNVTSPEQALRYDDDTRRYLQQVQSSLSQHANQQATAYAKETNANRAQNGATLITQNPEDNDKFALGVSMMHEAAIKNLDLDGLAENPDSVQRATDDVARDAVTKRLDALISVNLPMATQLKNDNLKLLAGGPGFDALNARLTEAQNRQRDTMVDQQVDAHLGGTGPVAQPIPNATGAAPADDLAAYKARTAQIEASGNPAAVNPGSGAFSQYQFTPATAKGLGIAPGATPDQIESGMDAFTNQNRSVLAQKLGQQPTWPQTYVAHAQGGSGAAALYQTPDMPAAETLAPYYGGDIQKAASAVTGVGGTPDMTGGQLTGYLEAKYNGSTPAQSATAAGSVGANGNQAPAPDWNSAKQWAYQQFGTDPKALARALGRVREHEGDWQADTADTRWKLLNDPVDSIEQKTRSALEGGYVGGLPEADIRSVFPPNQANKYISDFHVAQAVGSTLTNMRWDSPDQWSKDAADLEGGQGTLSQVIRTKAGEPASGPGAAGAPTTAPDAAFSKYRDYARVAIGQMDAQRQAALFDPKTADPVAFVMGHPDIQAAASQVQWNAPDPQTGEIPGFQSFAAQSLAKQAYLGVSPSGQHVLTRGMAESLSGNLTAPGTDPAQALTGMAKQYGAYWPHVFTDMVTLGNLPGGYESVGNLDPKNASILARGLNETKPKPDGSPSHTWDNLIGGDPGDTLTPTKISATIRNDSLVQSLTKSWLQAGSSASQVAERLGAIDTLALSRKLYLGDTDPVTNAIKAFTGNYNFLDHGGARVPVDKVPSVTQNLQVTLDGLKPETITAPPVYGQPFQPTPSEYAAWVQASPTWVNDKLDTSLLLFDPMGRAVLDKQGKQVNVPINAPPPVLPPPSEPPSLVGGAL